MTWKQLLYENIQPLGPLCLWQCFIVLSDFCDIPWVLTRSQEANSSFSISQNDLFQIAGRNENAYNWFSPFSGQNGRRVDLRVISFFSSDIWSTWRDFLLKVGGMAWRPGLMDKCGFARKHFMSGKYRGGPGAGTGWGGLREVTICFG